MQLRASQLSAGMKLVPSARMIERVVTQGAFMRTADDQTTREPWPKGRVEVKIDGLVRYWHRDTRVQIEDR